MPWSVGAARPTLSPGCNPFRTSRSMSKQSHCKPPSSLSPSRLSSILPDSHLGLLPSVIAALALTAIMSNSYESSRSSPSSYCVSNAPARPLRSSSCNVDTMPLITSSGTGLRSCSARCRVIASLSGSAFLLRSLMNEINGSTSTRSASGNAPKKASYHASIAAVSGLIMLCGTSGFKFLRRFLSASADSMFSSKGTSS